MWLGRGHGVPMGPSLSRGPLPLCQEGPLQHLSGPAGPSATSAGGERFTPALSEPCCPTWKTGAEEGSPGSAWPRAQGEAALAAPWGLEALLGQKPLCPKQ